MLKLKNLISDILDIENDDILDILNKLYIDSRYPGSLGLLPYGEPTLTDAKEFYAFASNIFDRTCIVLDIDLN